MKIVTFYSRKYRVARSLRMQKTRLPDQQECKEKKKKSRELNLCLAGSSLFTLTQKINGQNGREAKTLRPLAWVCTRHTVETDGLYYILFTRHLKTIS